MFYVRGNKKEEFFHNAIGDDFIRFLPKYMKCQKEDLEVFFVPDGVEAEVKNKRKFIPLETSYPYAEDENGNLKFIGNRLKEKAVD